MQDPKALQSIMQQAAPDLELAFKPMFGGILAYVAGKPCASLSDVGLALKLAGPAQEELLAMAGAERLRYAPDQPASKTYIVVPPALLADPGQLRAWIGRSIEGQQKAKPRHR